MSRSQRRAMIDREEPKLSLVRQCALLGISRSSLYYLPTEAGAEDLELMALIDQQYLKTPFYGSRRMTAWLSNHGHQVNRKRVRRLMQLIGLEAIYRRPNTSKPNPGHKVYPYLLRGLEINRVNQVWATDITYIPMARGFLYLMAIMDWHSRYVLAWRLSNTLAAVQHPGGRLLCCGSGRGLEQGSATDLQHRPGQPVHQRGLHQHAAGARRSSEHGRQGPVHGLQPAASSFMIMIFSRSPGDSVPSSRSSSHVAKLTANVLETLGASPNARSSRVVNLHPSPTFSPRLIVRTASWMTNISSWSKSITSVPVSRSGSSS